MMKLFYCLVVLYGLITMTACDKNSAEQPTLMKANTQFESEEKRDKHISYMRKNHMHALMHKRDDTLQQGIRTKKHSLAACIDCHVPVTYNGKVLRHDDEQHFCTSCHVYVAVKLNCFECHVDHPSKEAQTVQQTQTLDQLLIADELLSLEKTAKRWGVQNATANLTNVLPKKNEYTDTNINTSSNVEGEQ